MVNNSDLRRLGKITLVVVAFFLVISLLVSIELTGNNLSSLTTDINNLAGKITGFTFGVLGDNFTVADGSKPIAGYVFKYDGVTPAYNASVIVYVNSSDPTINPCFTLPTVYAGTDGSYVTNLNNLKNRTGDGTCNWQTGDPIWAEVNGSTMIPEEGYGISSVAAIGSGTGLQFLDNFSLAKGDPDAPNITLLAPANTSILDYHSIVFVYNVSDNRAVENCSLYINNSRYQTDFNVTNNASNNFTQYLVNSDYEWFVRCYDTSDNYNTSPTWYLTISVENKPPEFVNNTDDYSTPTLPTNTGASVTFSVNATDPDMDNYYLIICNSSIIFQNSTCNGTQICKSSATSSGAFASCQHSTVGETEQSYAWYSFVCDLQNCSEYNNTNSPYYLNFHPNYTTIPDQIWPEDTSHSINLSMYFSDPDGDNLTHGAPNPANISLFINSDNNTIIFTPDADWYGIRIFNITAHDPFGLSVTSNNFLLNVTNVNDAPIFYNITDKSILEDITPPSNWIDLYNYSYDIDNNYTELTYSLISQSNSSLINCALSLNRYVECGTPALDAYGINFLNLSVTDGEYTRFSTANITVISVNDPPTPSTPQFPPPGEETANATPSFNGTDSTDAENDTITYSLLIDCDGSSQNFADITVVTLRQDSNISAWILNQSLPEGYCNWTIYVCDDSNTSTACVLSNTTNNITIDLTPPDIVIDEPDPNEVLGWEITLYNTITDRWTRVVAAWYYIHNSTGSIIASGNLSANTTPPWSARWDSSFDFGVAGFTASGFKILAGETTKNYTYEVFAIDALGHEMNTSVNFTVNQNVPSVNIIYPKEDNLNDDFNLDIRIQSYNLTYSWYNITNEDASIQYAFNITSLSEAQYWNWTDYINIAGWPSGVYNISAYGEDATGANRTAMTYFNLDVDSPYYSNLKRTDPAYSTNLLYLNVTWTDNNLVQTVYISHNASGTWVNVTPFNISNEYFINISPSLLANQKIIYWYSIAKDNFNNWNTSMSLQSLQIENRPPVLNTSIPNITWPEDTVNDTLYLNQYFYDPDNDSITYSNSAVQNITVQINQTTTQVTFTPDANFTDVRNIFFFASDSINTTTSNNVTLNVTPVNDPPTLGSISLDPNYGNSGTVVNVSTQGAYDVDGDTYMLQCGNNSGDYNLCNSSFSTGEQSCTFIVPWSGVQTQVIYCILNDSLALSNERNSSFYNGNNLPTPPTVDVVPDIATSLDDLICNITVNSTDEDGDNISYYFQWYNYSQLILTYGPTTEITHLLGTGNTTDSEVWNCTVTPYDGKSLGNSSSDVVQLIACDCPDCNPPTISTIPDQKRSFNQGAWSINLSSYKSDIEDSGANLIWSVQGVNPLFIDVAVNGDLITFTPKPDISGLDKITITLTDTDNLIATQEIKVSINRTLEFINGWNLFSVPILENNSVQYILAPLGNGNYGCGHDDAPPYNCVPGDGDFDGDWTMIWTQNTTSGSWIYFRPDVYYTFIPTQGLQTLEVDQGYWIDMNITSPINLTLEYD